MSEWQPARILPEAHGLPVLGERERLIKGGPVRIRKVDDVFDECGGPYYIVHPDDEIRLGIEPMEKYVCAHEILTD